MFGLWQAIQALFFDSANRTERKPRSPVLMSEPDGYIPLPIPIVAMLLGDGDRDVLAKLDGGQQFQAHFAGSREAAWDALNRLASPVILYDRDWPGAEWRTAVQRLALTPHRACVILVSRVADDYLWQELIRCGGYDVLTKPLQADDATRVIRLALSYWQSSRGPAQRPQP
jgi:DNA-binding NtrC family response regulator